MEITHSNVNLWLQHFCIDGFPQRLLALTIATLVRPQMLERPLISRVVDCKVAGTCQSGEVWDARQRGVDGELESDGRQQQDERQLETILALVVIDRERAERHAADEELQTNDHRQTVSLLVNAISSLSLSLSLDVKSVALLSLTKWGPLYRPSKTS